MQLRCSSGRRQGGTELACSRVANVSAAEVEFLDLAVSETNKRRRQRHPSTVNESVPNNL